MEIRWSDVLDGILNGTGARPPMVATLRLPTIAGWSPAGFGWTRRLTQQPSMSGRWSSVVTLRR